MAITIITKNWSHYNRALGKYIKSKSHYDYEMKKQNMVSSEEGNRLAEQHNEKQWKPSSECVEVIIAMKNSADKKGNIVLGKHPKIVEVMEKKGMTFDMSKLPKHYQDIGGDI